MNGAHRTGFYVLLLHTFRTELRKAHGWVGLGLFALSSVYAAYRSVEPRPEADTWNALVWLVLMFSAFNALARPLADDVREVRQYQLHLLRPQDWIVARTLYHGILLTALACCVWIAFAVFMGTTHFEGMRFFWMLLGMVVTAWSLAGAITLLSALAARAGAGFGLTAVLGIPLVVPILLLSSRFGQAVISGLGTAEKGESLLFLGTFGVGAAAMGFVLFPYLWRE